MIASVYSWLVGQGLWPSALSAALFWLVPIVLGFVFGARMLGRVYRELTGLWREHIAAQREQTRHLARLASVVQSREEVKR